ncbi:clathrin light chain-like [Ornithodoros turicata]|uniref:clathrin light chain-like n=1 Tax=Ornithodoros turicata TaxID=34597 RepID=UPI003138ECE0
MIEDFSPFEVNFDSQLPPEELLTQDFSSGLAIEDDQFEPISPTSQFPPDVLPIKIYALDEQPDLPSQLPASSEEPETIKNWREQMNRQLERKDAEEELKKQELRQTAEKELADWYSRYRESVNKCKASNRSMATDWLAVRDAGPRVPEWDTIARLCDFNPKMSRNVKDISRMRSIILQLKQNPPLPSVSLTSI